MGGVDALLVTSIESVYTGDLARGGKQRYTRDKMETSHYTCRSAQCNYKIYFEIFCESILFSHNERFFTLGSMELLLLQERDRITSTITES
jgi:hypothetical protein